MRTLDVYLARVLSVLALATGARAQGDPSPAVSELFSTGQWGRAYEAAGRLSDARERAEWRCYLALQAGDLPRALDEARQGLAADGSQRGLLVNATSTALQLGLPRSSMRWARDLDLAVASAAQDAQAGERERADRLWAEARRLRELDQRAQACAQRARRVSLLGVGLALALLAFMALRRPASQS